MWDDDEPNEQVTDIKTVRNDFNKAIVDLRSEMHQLSVDDPTTRASGGLADLDDVVTEFSSPISNLEARTSGEGFASGDHVFNSAAAVLDFLEEEVVPNAGCFWDLFSVLASMSPKRQRGKDKADETYSAKRIQSTQLDNDLLASMTHERPDVLYARRVGGDLGCLEDGFVACPTYKAWITGTESNKMKLTKELKLFCSGVNGSIPKGASYCGLAISLLSDVKNRWSTLCAFIDTFYIKLTDVALFPIDKAWKLTGRCLAAVFTAMGSHRAPVSLLDDLVPLENKGSCMWGVMQCHQIVFEFEKVDYRGHPVVTEMNLLLLMERVDPGIPIANEERIKRLENDAKSASTEAKRMDEKIKKLERDLTNLTTAVGTLRTKCNKP
jgi:hypothetical protein